MGYIPVFRLTQSLHRALMPGPRMQHPKNLCGTGLRPKHYSYVSENPTQMGFFEIISENYMDSEGRPRAVLRQMLRIGQKAIVSFPNFGHYQVRLQLLLSGRMPRTAALDRTWFDTPNIHLCSIRDFLDLCGEAGARVEAVVASFMQRLPGLPIRGVNELDSSRGSPALPPATLHLWMSDP